jgi:hypothetical protein
MTLGGHDKRVARIKMEVRSFRDKDEKFKK